jgi:peptidoglycan/xylan/chitin deacetylase (PgdA/CDA1 family)
MDEGNTQAKRNAVRAYLATHGYRIAQVTIDYSDWAWTDAYTRCFGKHDNKTVQWLKDHIGDSADRHLDDSERNTRLLFKRDIPQILLIHIALFNTFTLDKILKDWRARGVQFISLDEALSDPVYAIDPRLTYEGGRTFLEQIAEARDVEIVEEDPKYSTDRLNQICK